VPPPTGEHAFQGHIFSGLLILLFVSSKAVNTAVAINTVAQVRHAVFSHFNLVYSFLYRTDRGEQQKVHSANPSVSYAPLGFYDRDYLRAQACLGV
jgi:hypothetical protein